MFDLHPAFIAASLRFVTLLGILTLGLMLVGRRGRASLLAVAGAIVGVSIMIWIAWTPELNLSSEAGMLGWKLSPLAIAAAAVGGAIVISIPTIRRRVWLCAALVVVVIALSLLAGVSSWSRHMQPTPLPPPQNVTPAVVGRAV